MLQRSQAVQVFLNRSQKRTKSLHFNPCPLRHNPYNCNNKWLDACLRGRARWGKTLRCDWLPDRKRWVYWWTEKYSFISRNCQSVNSITAWNVLYKNPSLSRPQSVYLFVSSNKYIDVAGCIMFHNNQYISELANKNIRILYTFAGFRICQYTRQNT